MNKVLTLEQRERKNARRREWGKSPEQREKMRLKNKAYRLAHPDYAARWRENRRVARALVPGARRYESHKRNYKLTPEAFDALLAAQGGRCGICRKPLVLTDRRTHVDHDHVTKRVRGILCQPCNVGIGMLGDTLDGLIAAVNYLGGNASCRT